MLRHDSFRRVTFPILNSMVATILLDSIMSNNNGNSLHYYEGTLSLELLKEAILRGLEVVCLNQMIDDGSGGPLTLKNYSNLNTLQLGHGIGSGESFEDSTLIAHRHRYGCGNRYGSGDGYGSDLLGNPHFNGFVDTNPTPSALRGDYWLE